ncbi:ADP-ribosylation factor-related protein 1 [Hordeum vulgare]|nr:ADP-ribosylation factor-related protein 1 [Hordeum vulgare]
MGKHNHEVGSSSANRRSSSPMAPAPPALPAFAIMPPAAPQRNRSYVSADICRRYWETATRLLWGEARIPNNWHLSVERVPIPSVPMSDRTRREDIDRRRARFPPNPLYNRMYTVESPMWDTGLRDEHDLRRQSFLIDRPPSLCHPRRARGESPPQTHGCMRVRGLTPMPSPSPSPPSSPPTTEEEEAKLMRRVMEDSMNTHNEHQWERLETALALFAAGDVTIPKLEMAVVVKEEVQEEVVEESPLVA